MKRLSFIFLLQFLVFVGYAQVKFHDEAYSKYHDGDYQAAIKLYRARLAQKQGLNDRFMLATCYVKVDSIAQAKQEFEKILVNYDNHRIFAGTKVEACDEVAKLYLQEKNYRKALEYYQLYESIFEKGGFDDINWSRIHFFNTNDQARCYAALGLTDSAITVMTPYMFYNHKALNQMMFVPAGYSDKKDSLQHDSITRFYITFLQKRNRNKQIKADFKKAEQSFTFTEERPADDVHGYLAEHFKCSITIYGLSFVFLERSLGDKKDKLLKEVEKPYYTKAYQLEFFRRLPVCQMVRSLPNSR